MSKEKQRGRTKKKKTSQKESKEVQKERQSKEREGVNVLVTALSASESPGSLYDANRYCASLQFSWSYRSLTDVVGA